MTKGVKGDPVLSFQKSYKFEREELANANCGLQQRWNLNPSLEFQTSKLTPNITQVHWIIQLCSWFHLAIKLFEIL